MIRKIVELIVGFIGIISFFPTVICFLGLLSQLWLIVTGSFDWKNERDVSTLVFLALSFVGSSILFLFAGFFHKIFPQSQTTVNQIDSSKQIQQPSSNLLGKPQFESPIEKLFWDEWQRQGGDTLIPLIYQYQAPINQYRIDFVHLASKTAIELDGYEYHSSRQQFTRDRKRQRELERLGWRFIRFSGSEISRNPAECFKEMLELLHADNSLGAKSSVRRPARSRKEIAEKLSEMIQKRQFHLSEESANKPIVELSLEEQYRVAAEDIAFSEAIATSVLHASSSGAWLFWIDFLEQREKEEQV